MEFALTLFCIQAPQTMKKTHVKNVLHKSRWIFFAEMGCCCISYIFKKRFHWLFSWFRPFLMRNWKFEIDFIDPKPFHTQILLTWFSFFTDFDFDFKNSNWKSKLGNESFRLALVRKSWKKGLCSITLLLWPFILSFLVPHTDTLPWNQGERESKAVVVPIPKASEGVKYIFCRIPSVVIAT